MRIRHGIWSAVVLIALVSAVAAAAAWVHLHPAPQIVRGEVDATEVKVSSKVAGRVGAVLVREGETVEEGRPLVTLDCPEIRAKLLQATAAKNAAQAQENKAFKGARQEQIRSAFNVWKQALAGADLAEKTFHRVGRLFDAGVLPEQKRDEAEAQWKASSEMEQAARATYEMALAGTREEDKTAATAVVAKAAGAVSEVEAYLKETELTSPISGEVAELIAERGELVSPGFPILTLVDLSDVWITFNLREDLLPQIRMGSTMVGEFPALNGRLVPLSVNYISALGDFAVWRATKASGDFDLKTFEVRAVPLERVEGLRPGMSALVDWGQFSKGRDSGGR